MKYITLFAVFCMSFQYVIAQTDVKEKNHVFFLHSKILEDMGNEAYSNQYGKYEYDSIVNEFVERDYVLYTQVRPKGAIAEHYAMTLAKQVDSLLFSGVKANRITILGTSKGALITMLASSYIKQKGVKFVIIGMCNEFTSSYFSINMHGKILSIYEKSDKIGRSCNDIIAQSEGISSYKEIELNTGLKHGFTYRPMPEWIIPVFQWIES